MMKATRHPLDRRKRIVRNRASESAPGRRVVEPQGRSWRAGYVILPIALVVGVLQVLIPSPRGGTGALEDQRQVSAYPPPVIDEAASAQVEPQAPPLRDPGAVTSSTSAADEASLVEPASLRIAIHHAAGTENALPAIQLAAFLQEQGFDVTDIRPVDVEIERPSVRYFFDGDQPETRSLIEAIAAFYAEAPDQAPDELAGLSPLSPQSRRGDIEVWLPPPASGASHST